MSDEPRNRDNWGPEFRDSVSRGRMYGCAILVVGVLMMKFGETAVLEWAGGVAFVVSLGAIFPKSPVLAWVVERIPWAANKGV